MQSTSYSDKPYEVEISGSGFSSCARFATMTEAYTEAQRVRTAAQAGEQVAFTNCIGDAGSYLVLAIRILRWNPLISDVLSHARRWTLNNTPDGALTPLPADWHHDPLPADWYGTPEEVSTGIAA